VLDQPSAGSTAPLWTLLLSVGFLLRIPPRLWTYLLGGLSLAGTGLLAHRPAVSSRSDNRRRCWPVWPASWSGTSSGPLDRVWRPCSSPC
jgi:hypothetical protein